jgi:hypothetical protein
VLLCLASLKGSPGVTTAAVALAARWPTSWRRLVVEADPAGGDLAVRYRLSSTPGLMSLAAAARHRADPDLVAEHAQLLPGGLPVVVGPTRPDQVNAALTAITRVDGGAGVLGWFAGRGDVVAVVDCGRLRPDSPAERVVAGADQLLIVARPFGDALAHVADLMTDPDAGIMAGPALVRLLLVGAGYPRGEIEREVGLGVAATLPWDPRTAAAVAGHAARSPRARSPLARAAGRLAAELAGGAPRRRAGGGEDAESVGDVASTPVAAASPNGSAGSRWGP